MLTDRQKQKFQNLRQSGDRQAARQFRQKALRRNERKANNQPFDPATGEGGLFGGPGNVALGPELSKDLAKGAAVGQELVDRFAPDISTLGTVDAGRSPEIQNLLNQGQALTQTAGQMPESEAALQLLKQGTDGLTAAENDALRARGFQGIGRNFMAGNRALARAQGRSGVQGAAGAAQYRDLNRDFMDAGQALERDILLENMAVQDRRRNSLNQFAQGLESTQFGQQQQALGALQNMTQAARADELNREQFNLGQQQNLLDRQQNLFFGGMGLFEGKKNAIQNLNQQKAQQDRAIAEANAQAQAAQAAATQMQQILAQNQLPNLGGGGIV